MNFLKGISDKKLQESEINLLKFSGLEENEYELKDIDIGDGNFIHTFISGKGTTPLVMIHGYGASGVFFYKMFKQLSEHYKVYSIDLLGMGSSSRPEFTAKNVAEAEKFFVDSIEQWRIAMGFEKIILAGHSFGGYMSSVYALQFPQHIIKLLLLSPVGLPKRPQGFSLEEVINNQPSKTRKVLGRFVVWMWSKNLTPFSALRVSSRLIAPSLLKIYTRRRFKSIKGLELTALEKHIYQIAMRKGSGEYALNIILEPGAWAKEPLRTKLEALEVPVTFFYGEVDWMEPKSAIELLDILRVPANVEIVSGAGHHLYFDNPADFTESIIRNLDITSKDDPDLFREVDDQNPEQATEVN